MKSKQSPEDFAAMMSLMSRMVAQKAARFARRAAAAINPHTLNTSQEQARRVRQMKAGTLVR